MWNGLCSLNLSSHLLIAQFVISAVIHALTAMKYWHSPERPDTLLGRHYSPSLELCRRRLKITSLTRVHSVIDQKNGDSSQPAACTRNVNMLREVAL